VSYAVRLLANAQQDLADIEAYYNEKVPHETERCLDGNVAALDWIARNAHQPTVTRFGLRHISSETFKYYVWYRLFEEEQFAQVVAILHHRRGDEALAERMP
jgi:plasmid stabilization system protein ParE